MMISFIRQPERSGPDTPRRGIFLWMMAVLLGLMGLARGVIETLNVGGVERLASLDPN